VAGIASHGDSELRGIMVPSVDKMEEKGETKCAREAWRLQGTKEKGGPYDIVQKLVKKEKKHPGVSARTGRRNGLRYMRVTVT